MDERTNAGWSAYVDAGVGIPLGAALGATVGARVGLGEGVAFFELDAVFSGIGVKSL